MNRFTVLSNIPNLKTKLDNMAQIRFFYLDTNILTWSDLNARTYLLNE